jgi:hypothetical protein
MPGTVRVLVAPSSSGGSHESKGILASSADAVLAEVDVERLKVSFTKLSGDISQMFASDTGEKHGYRLKQITVGVEISAEGSVTLIGSLKAAGKAAITLTFERA